MPTWVYRFARARPGDHGAEIPYVFDTHDAWLPMDADDRLLTRRMMDYWLNFARTGDPNGETLPTWPRWRPVGDGLVPSRRDLRVALQFRWRETAR